jgi:hypothetical protein
MMRIVAVARVADQVFARARAHFDISIKSGGARRRCILIGMAMGGRTVLALAMCTAATTGACDRSGLELDVRVPDGVTSVEIRLGQPTCNGSGDAFSCSNGSSAAIGTVGEGIAWSSAGPSAAGDIHELITISHSEAVHGGSATFLLDTRDLPSPIGALAIIGLDASGVPQAMTVLDDVSVPQRAQLSIQLPAVTAVDVPPTGSDQTPAVHLWTSGSASCLAWFPPATDPSSPPGAEFIVPADDHDCDGFAIDGTTECDDYWAHSVTLGGMCATREAIGSSSTGSATMPCVLGSAAACMDGQLASSTGCMPNPTLVACVPDAVCDVCGSPLNDNCFPTELGSSSTVSHAEIDCTFPYLSLISGKTQCALPATSEVAIVYTALGSPTFEVDSFALAPMLLAGIGSTLNVGSGAVFTVGALGVVGTGSGSGSGLAMTLTWTSGFPSANQPPYFLRIGSAANTTTAGSAALIPLVISFPEVSSSQTCMASCALTTTTDEVWTCAPPGK